MSPLQFSTVASIHTFASLLGPVLLGAAKKTSSSGFTLIFFVLLFAVGYMFLIRPQRQRRQRQMQQNRQIAVGDRVMLSSGIFGRVEGFVGDHVRVEIAPGLVIEVVRQAVSQRVDEPVDANVAPTDTSFHDGSHDDVIDDSGHDPYSVPPLDSSNGAGTAGEVEHPDGANGGGER